MSDDVASGGTGQEDTGTPTIGRSGEATGSAARLDASSADAATRSSATSDQTQPLDNDGDTDGTETTASVEPAGDSADGAGAGVGRDGTVVPVDGAASDVSADGSTNTAGPGEPTDPTTTNARAPDDDETSAETPDDDTISTTGTDADGPEAASQQQSSVADQLDPGSSIGSATEPVPTDPTPTSAAEMAEQTAAAADTAGSVDIMAEAANTAATADTAETTETIEVACEETAESLELAASTASRVDSIGGWTVLDHGDVPDLSSPTGSILKIKRSNTLPAHVHQNSGNEAKSSNTDDASRRVSFSETIKEVRRLPCIVHL